MVALAAMKNIINTIVIPSRCRPIPQSWSVRYLQVVLLNQPAGLLIVSDNIHGDLREAVFTTGTKRYLYQAHLICIGLFL